MGWLDKYNDIPKAQSGKVIPLDEVEIEGYSRDKQALYDRYVKDNHFDSDSTHGINFLYDKYVTPDRNYMKEGYEKDLAKYNDSLKLWKIGEEEKRRYFELLKKNNLSADDLWNYSKEQGMSRSAKIQPINYNRVLRAQNPENMWGQRSNENYYRTITKEEGVDEDKNTYRYSIDGKIKKIPWDSKTAFEIDQGYHTFKKPTRPVPPKPRKKVEVIKSKTKKVSSIKQKENNTLIPRRETPVNIKSYDVTQIHDKHSTRGKHTTPEKTEELFDDYQRFKDIEGGPRLKVIPNYQDGGWLGKYENGGVIKDNRGQWDHPGEITEISGNKMRTDGYGDTSLYVVPDKGSPKVIHANTGTHEFPGATKFTEYPMAQDHGDLMKKDNTRVASPHVKTFNPQQIENVANSNWAFESRIRLDDELWQEREDNTVYPPEWPELNLKDKRKIRATTGKPVRPKYDLIGDKYQLNNIDDIMQYARHKGLTKEDLWNLAAIEMQETGWGKRSEGTVGHVLGNYGGNDDAENFVNAYIAKKAEAKRLGITDPAKILQIYNGTGIVRKDTEKDVHGYEMKKIYGVSIPKEGIDMSKNPLYGKQIIDIRDNVLKNDVNVKKYIDSTAASKEPFPQYLMPEQMNSPWEKYLWKLQIEQEKKDSLLHAEQEEKRVRDLSGGELFPIEKELKGGKIEQNGGWIDKMQDGNTVSQTWEKTTGTNWSQAKERGLTDGSYDNNIKLLNDLKSGMYDRDTPNTPISENTNFNEAFAKARKIKGANKLFRYEGKIYGTNIANEKFNPTDAELKQFKIDTPEVKQNIKENIKIINSPYVSTATVDNTPITGEPKWQNWNDIRARDAELNKMSNVDLINQYHKRDTKTTSYTVKSGDNLSEIARDNGVTLQDLKTSNNLKSDLIKPNQKLSIEIAPEGATQYLIIDKKTGKSHLYRGGKEVASFDMLVGENEGDAQTVTKVKDPSDDGIPITSEESKTAKADWPAGNKSTGAGEFTISVASPTSERQYGRGPSFNLKNNVGDEISTTLHGAPGRRNYFGSSNPKRSNGCINGKCKDLDELYNTYGLTKGDKVYILPEDEGNNFIIRNNKLVFDVNSEKDYENYTDKRGKPQKGQGINRTVNSLKYNPIKIEFDEGRFREEKFTALDFDDEKELNNVVKPFIAALSKDKQQLMKDLKIDGDIYNEIAKATFGIFGVESTFGDTNLGITNLGKGIYRKSVDWLNEKGYTNKKTPGAPDTKTESMYNAIMGNEEFASSGLTQVVWGQLSASEKKTLYKYNIYSVRSLNNPKKAALATLIILGHRYNNEIKGKKNPSNIESDLAFAWNHGKKYDMRVKHATRFINLKELR